MQSGDLTHRIIGSAMRVHGTLGSGFLESVYRNALAHEFHNAGIRVLREHPIDVLYDGVVVGEFIADFLAEDSVILEVKAVRALAVAHEVQLVNYLSATGIDVGLLVNFGSTSLEYKRKQRIFHKSQAISSK